MLLLSYIDSALKFTREVKVSFCYWYVKYGLDCKTLLCSSLSHADNSVHVCVKKVRVKSLEVELETGSWQSLVLLLNDHETNTVI